MDVSLRRIRMSKKCVLVALLMLMPATAFAQPSDVELHGSIGVNYLSEYIWRGFDLYADDDGAIQGTASLDLWGTGFGMNLLYSRSTEGRHENDKWIVPTLFYSNNIAETERWMMVYTIGYTYYNYPDQPKNGTARAPNSAMQEVFGAFAFPQLIGGGLVPSYTIVRMWPSSGDATTRELVSDWAHIFGLDYSFPICGLLPNQPEQIVKLHAETVFNDGVGPCPLGGGQRVDSDWTHALFGATTDFDLSSGWVLTPGLWYQSSWDDSVNNEDELFAQVNLKYNF